MIRPGTWDLLEMCSTKVECRCGSFTNTVTKHLGNAYCINTVIASLDIANQRLLLIQPIVSGSAELLSHPPNIEVTNRQHAFPPSYSFGRSCRCKLDICLTRLFLLTILLCSVASAANTMNCVPGSGSVIETTKYTSPSGVEFTTSTSTCGEGLQTRDPVNGHKALDVGFVERDASECTDPDICACGSTCTCFISEIPHAESS